MERLSNIYFVFWNSCYCRGRDYLLYRVRKADKLSRTRPIVDFNPATNCLYYSWNNAHINPCRNGKDRKLTFKIFCLFKILHLILKTSMKVSRLMRNDEDNQVDSIKRRLYLYLAMIGVLIVITLLDVALNRFRFMYALAIAMTQSLYFFLDFVRRSIESLEVCELTLERESSVPLESASEMESQASKTPNTREKKESSVPYSHEIDD